MIVRCPDCRSKYEIAADKIPVGVFKLRCPRCKAVFPVNAQIEAEAAAGEPAAPSTAAAHQPAAPSTAAAHQPAREVRLPEPTGVASPVSAVIERPRISDPALARRMARAMISEMVLNRRSERDEALSSETVLSRFGPAIASAFELYRGKVSPDLPSAPAYFRDAVNEILGGGSAVL